MLLEGVSSSFYTNFIGYFSQNSHSQILRTISSFRFRLGSSIKLFRRRDVAHKEVGWNEVKYLLQHIQQNVLDGLGDDRVQGIGQHPPVVVEELVGAVLCGRRSSKSGQRLGSEDCSYLPSCLLPLNRLEKYDLSPSILKSTCRLVTL